MAYEKNTWKTGDIVASAKLNHMEDGIASNCRFVVKFSSVDGTTWAADKTVAECIEAYNNGMDLVAIGKEGSVDVIFKLALCDTENKVLNFQAITWEGSDFFNMSVFGFYEEEGTDVVERMRKAFYNGNAG
jgi:formylmethanofuran dehydrogenase subunit A